MINGRFTHALRLRELYSSPHALVVALAAAPDPLPDSVASSIGMWRLLENVPFNYLVPDPGMLPPESIRFFQVDNLWVDALIDGAFSLGRSTSTDLALDQALMGPAKAKGAVEAVNRRAIKLGVSAGAVPASPGVASGFLLRSQAVSGWPGLQAEGQDAQNNPLKIIRMSHLSDDVLICIFAGLLSTLLVQPPSEGLHFGFNDDGSKTLRYTTTVAGSHNAGEPIPGVTVNRQFRDQSVAGRVVNIAQLKADMLKNLPASETVNFTAAEFALEMTTGPDEVYFQFPPSTLPGGAVENVGEADAR